MPICIVDQNLRNRREEVGLHEPASVPQSHLDQVAPLSGQPGYGLSNLLLLKGDCSLTRNGLRVNLTKALTMPGTNALDSETPIELLVRIAKSLSLKPHLGWVHILKYLFPQDILDKENCRTTYQQINQVLSELAPNLWQFYRRLTPSQKAELGIATVPCEAGNS